MTTRCCDLVMKGGITSGVVYPPAIHEIAKRFYLMGIGGASAGAIAACGAAAAEYRRRSGGGLAGFDELEKVAREDLGGEGRLLGLFRPDESTRSLFDLGLDFLNRNERSGWRGLWDRASLFARGAWSVARLNKRLAPLVENNFGLCTGMANGARRASGDIAPLSEWMTDLFDRVAGHAGPDPLVFGDLRAASPPELFGERGLPGRPSIDLRVVTTCLSFSRPYELPMDGHYEFAFDPREWRRLFPERVVAYLERAAEKVDAPALKRGNLLPFPVGDRMPIVVAARMSLSFPVLFAMVPLYAVDYDDAAKPMRKVWFSDGGITSNIPVHRFDALFPRWPTLGINLRYMGESGDAKRLGLGSDRIYMIKRLSDGARNLWNAFGGGSSALGDLLGFVFAIFTSAQVWHDEAYLRAPGFRDRMVEIWLDSTEGGLNLDMGSDLIRDLMKRGRDAGTALVDRFATSTAADDGLSWPDHRWTRLRTALEGLAEYLQAFEHNATNPLPGDGDVSLLLQGAYDAKHYPIGSRARAEGAANAVAALRTWIRELGAAGDGEPHPFADGPRPKVSIGTRATI